MKLFHFNQKSGSGILLLFTLLASYFSQAQNNIVYPAAAGVVNMVTQYGLVPNNSSQASANTLKIQQAINEHKGRRGAQINQVLYFPNGTYFINDKLTLGSARTDDTDSTEARELTIQGQSESGTVIKLVDGSVGYGTGEAKPLLAFFEGAGWNAAMGNYLNNITIDIGADNPGAIGVDFHNNNYGGIYDVTIKSSDAQKKGAIGLKMNRELTGIGYIKNVRIEGFDIGIKTGSFKIAYTMEYIDLVGQRVAGIENTDKPLQIRKLTSTNSVPAIINKTRQGHIVLIDSYLGGGSSAFPAIDNQEGFLFLRNVTSTGYQMTVKDGELNKDAALNDDGEYSSHGADRLWAATPLKSMNLDVKDAPEVTWDAPADWAVVDPNANGTADDADAIQAAINSGKSTVCVKSGDIFINKSIVFPFGHQVKRFIVFGRIAALGIDPVFIIQTGTREALVIQGIRTLYNDNPIQFFQNNSTKTLILRQNGIYGCTKVYRNGPGAGTLFIEDMATLPGGAYGSQQPGPAFQFDNQEVYARSYDPENALPLTFNNGGRLWVLGFKVEGTGIAFVTENGGFTEVLGGQVNGTFTGEYPEMIFNDNSHVSFIATERAQTTSVVRQTVIREKRGSEEKVFTFGQLDTVSGSKFVPSSVVTLYAGYDPVALSKTRTFSEVAYFNDPANYSELNPSRWEVITDDSGNRSYSINTTDYSNLSGQRLGEYALVKNRSYGNFTMTLKAASPENFSTNTSPDYAVVFGYQDADNYAYINFTNTATELFRVLAGVRQAAIATSTLAAFSDTAYKAIEVSRAGNKVVVKQGNTLLLNSTNQALSATGSIGIGSFDDAAYFDDIVIQEQVLPIKLTSFTATSDGGKVNLKWTTATETNNAYFTVEHSVDGNNFIAIATVKGAGNSSQHKEYSTVDQTPFTGIKYYRIKQTDLDGHYTFSEIKSVKISNDHVAKLIVWPNPVINKATITYQLAQADRILLEVFTIKGKKVATLVNGKQQAGTQQIIYDSSLLAEGIYLVKLATGNERYALKLLVAK